MIEKRVILCALREAQRATTTISIRRFDIPAGINIALLLAKVTTFRDDTWEVFIVVLLPPNFGGLRGPKAL